ncbi:MAG: ribosome maturation factor RimP [Burkholderiales bacterium]|nr:ribosome maturation factor RimP [Burkholderiales bacterium]
MLNKLSNLLELTVPGLGYELVDFEITPARTIVVFIDKPGGITIEDCEKTSKHLSNLFLVEEINYNRLEISSPGLERALKTLADFTRFMNNLVKIKTKELINEQKVFQGIIKQVQGNDITIELDIDNIITINFDNIYKAKLIFELKKRVNLKK